MDFITNINNVQECTEYANPQKQKECDKYLKATYKSCCMCLREYGRCDWNPDFSCIKKSSYKPDVPRKSKTSWPTKEELAERQQTVIDNTEFGV